MGSSLLYISITYYMQKGWDWVQKACKIAYVINGRSLRCFSINLNVFWSFPVLPPVRRAPDQHGEGVVPGAGLHHPVHVQGHQG